MARTKLIVEDLAEIFFYSHLLDFMESRKLTPPPFSTLGFLAALIWSKNEREESTEVATFDLESSTAEVVVADFDFLEFLI